MRPGDPTSSRPAPVRAPGLRAPLGPAQRLLLAALQSVLWLYLVAGRALADDARVEYSDLERELIAEQLARRGASVDPAPEGKRIEAVDVVVLDVFDDRDPVPKWVNTLHVTSREYTITRELLIGRGDTWSQRLANESARNLRTLRQLSVVLILPLAGSEPDQVRMLVIVKDVWSLRVNNDFTYADGRLQSLLLQPSEENLFGTHRTVNALFTLDLGRYSLGAGWINPRIDNSRILAALSANIIFNRETGDPEGSFGGFSYGQPLYATVTEWAWTTNVAWRNEVTRLFQGGELATYEAADGTRVPWRYRTDRQAGEYELTHSAGTQDKLDVSGGAEASRRVYRVPGDGLPADAVAEFQREQVPVSDTRVSPFLTLHVHSTRFLRVLNFETLGLQEDFQIGHRLRAKLYPASTAVGSTRDLLGVHTSGSYTWPISTGLFRITAANTIELTREADQSDALGELGSRLVSPRTRVGRLVLDGRLALRYRNYLNQQFLLGGQTRPRGYPSFAFVGKDAAAGSVELRTGAINVLSAQLGAVMFYDAADAADGFARLDFHHSVGTGLRVLFPQADRVVLRFDWGFPVADDLYGTFPGAFVATFEQAFPVPAVAPPSVFEATTQTF